jgi:bifunctional non-homologous end joining protein LigD
MRERQPCVVGGVTEDRDARRRSLLLGVYDAGRLRYVGRVRVAVGDAAAVWRRVERQGSSTSPFVDPPADAKTRPRWLKPLVVVEVEHGGWVNGTLGHPVTLRGTRADVHPRSVRRQAMPTDGIGDVSRWSPSAGGTPDRLPRPLTRVVRELERLEHGPGAGVLTLPDGFTLAVHDLRKDIWPSAHVTKGELLRYYLRIAPLLLPTVRGRPLVGKYYPDGVRGPRFFQQRAPAEVPRGVDVRVLDIDIPVRRRLVGGSLLTLLYMVDAGVISQDPWLSRVGTLDEPDYCVFDLDPMPGATFGTVRDVARAVRDALARLGVAVALPKLSGRSGLHVYVPLAAGTPYAESRTLCGAVAEFVAARHPRAATTERTVQRRGRRVYIDCLQNLRGKTLATAYSARASAFAVSAPVRWTELDEGVGPQEFTIRNLEARIRAVGDLWAPMRTARGVAPRTLAGGRLADAPRRGRVREA